MGAIGRVAVGGAVAGWLSWLVLYHLLGGVLPVSDRTALLACVGIGAAASSRRGLRRRAWQLAAAAAILALVVGYTSLSGRLARSHFRADAIGPVEAVVVLSSSVNADEALDASGLERLLEGLALVRAGLANLLVTTTLEARLGSRSIRSVKEQQRMTASYLDPDVQWLRTGVVTSTRDEAIQVRELLQPLGIRRIAVVTSPSHSRRACATFEATAFVVQCRPAVSHRYAAIAVATPRDRHQAFGEWVYESLATAVYRVNGWLPQSSPRTLWAP